MRKILLLSTLLFLSVAATANGDLIQAAKDNSSARIQDLLNLGVDIDSRDENGLTALMWAAKSSGKIINWFDQKKGAKAALKLIAAGANLDLKDNHGWDAFTYVCVDGSVEVAKAMIKKAGSDAKALVNRKDADGHYPLHRAASRNYLALGKVLINAGANPNQKNDSGDLPIHFTDGGLFTNKDFCDYLDRLTAGDWGC